MKKQETASEDRQPSIHYFGEIGSCLDTAFDLAQAGRLQEWDSVQARMQTSGRGQMRRNWSSLEGNLFGTIRLPYSAPFNSTTASMALGALCANALRSFGCHVYLKWPNDLVLRCNGVVGKVGGILLEEKDNILLAGIGINILSAPDKDDLRDEAIMPAVSIGESQETSKIPSAEDFWRALVKHVYTAYKNGPAFGKIWKELVEQLLLWRGRQVELVDYHESCRGIFSSVNENGAAMIQTRDGMHEVYNGSMRLLPDNFTDSDRIHSC